MTTTQIFNARFDAIKNEVAFNDDWSNGTGYYDGAVQPAAESEVKLAIGEQAKCTSPMPNNRKMIFTGTPFGTIVVFERFTGGDNGAFVCNATSKLNATRLYSTSGGLKSNDLELILGNPDHYNANEENIGTILARIMRMVPYAEEATVPA